MLSPRALKAPKYFLEISHFLWKRKKGGERISVLCCILWIDDTVICETSPAFAIINSQQSQGTGMCSPQAGGLLTLEATKDWA